MKRIISIILCILIGISMLSPVIYGTFRDVCEIYSISYTGGTCEIFGRIFAGEGVPVNLTATSDGSTVRRSALSSADGSFIISFAAQPDLYNLSITADGKTMNQKIDLSFVKDIIEGISEDYGVINISFSSYGVTINGNTGTADDIITLQITEKGELPGANPETIVDMRDTQCDENGAYSLRFNVPEGEYSLYLMSRGKEMSRCDINMQDLSDIFTKYEYEFDDLIERFNSYVSEIELKIAECRAESIPTDYEDAYLEIIKKYIEWIKIEETSGDYTRMGNYNYGLTRIYTETMNNLDGYLSGEKQPFRVPEYRTGDIRFDGTGVIGTTEINGVVKERPVFLTGYGIWETVVKEIPFLASIGHNFIQSEAYMHKVISPVRGGGWYIDGLDENGISQVEVFSTTEEKLSGQYSLKAVNPSDILHNVFRNLKQKVLVKPNTTYEIGLKAKAKGVVEQTKTNSNCSAWFNVNGIYSGTRYGIRNSNDWQSYDFEYTTDNNEDEIEFLIHFGNKIDALYIDDIYVREKGSTINLIDNGDFEKFPENPTEDDLAVAEKGWYINYHYLNEVKENLARAQKYNIAVDIILSPAEMPKFIYYSDEEIYNCGTGFMPFPVDNQTVRDAIGFYARAVGKAIKDSESAVSICLTNEPEVKAAYCGDHYKPAWIDFLKEKYNNNLATLNQAYQDKNYTSFDNVAMPTIVSNTPIFYDYIEFNDGLLSDFHMWYRNEVRKVNPDIPIHTKTMQYFRQNYRNYFLQGTNYELVGDILDLNGCDAWSEYENNGSLLSKMAWYDLMTSIADKPVWNTEDHLTSTGETKTSYSETETRFVESDLWNGAMHGSGGTAIWVLNDSKTMVAQNGSVHSNSNVIHKPEQMMQSAKVAMDLNRLSEEVTALQKEKPKVGVLYSRTSIGYTHETYNDDYNDYKSTHQDEAIKAYESAIQTGQKVGFITDTTYDEIDDYELVIIPEATNVPADVLNAVKGYIEKGGKVLLTGTDSFKKNEYNKANDSTTVNYIYNNADSQSSVRDKIIEMGLSEVVVKDADTGEIAEGIEWTYAEYGGGYVVNVLNYDYEQSKNIKIEVNGKEVKLMTDLRSGSKSESGVIEAEALSPMLLMTSGISFDLIDENGDILEENIDVLRSGKIRCISEGSEGTVVIALYKGGVLEKVSMTGVMDIDDVSDGKYRLMATVWDMPMIRPLSGSRNIFN